MEEIKRKYVDWKKTGKKLQTLRERDINLIRYACYVCHFNLSNCDGNCEGCTFDGDLDNRITREELARVFSVGDSVIVNWETGRTPVSYEDLLYYCQISKKNIEDIVVYEE